MTKATPRASRRGPEPRQARFGVYLPLKVRKALLKAAIDEGTSATVIVERLIKDYLRGRGKRG